jgi:tetratricopeptide (TPR) repeat protein
MQSPSWKERLSEKLADYPLLRTLLLNPWFALAFFAVALLGLGTAVCLPKVWLTTPPDFTPVIKISILDMIQARSLRASARRHAEAGRHREAAIAWQSATANDPGNLELHRALFRHLAQAPVMPLSQVNRAFRGIAWMLQLGATNQTDLELVATALDRYGLSEDVFTLLSPQAGRLSPSLEAAYLKALFQVGRYDEFGRRWERVQPQVAADAELALCHAAYVAGWGSLEDAATARQQVQQALDDPRLGTYACRLEMSVCAQRLDVTGYQEALRRLQAGSHDRVLDHVRYWRLLHATGRTAEARARANTFNRPPQSGHEVVQMAEVLIALGLNAECLDFLQRQVREFGRSYSIWSVAVWAAYADVLIAGRNWEQLKEVALEMRALPAGAQAALGGFSQFLEGRVAYVQGSPAAARAAFTEAVRLGFPLGRVGVRVARQLNQMGFADLALETLRPLEPRFENDLLYWKVVFDASYALRADDTLLLRAAARAYELAPQSTEWKFNYAAALLIGRRRPEQALSLTLDLLETDGRTPGGLINHAIALSLNHRYDDAAEILREINPERLNEPQRVAYQMAWLDIYYEADNWAGVRESLRHVDPAGLFPCQQRWIEEIRQAMPK